MLGQLLELGARGEVGLDGVLRQMDELPGSVEVLEAVVGVGLHDVVVWADLVAPERPDFPVEGALAAAAAPNKHPAPAPAPLPEQAKASSSLFCSAFFY